MNKAEFGLDQLKATDVQEFVTVYEPAISGDIEKLKQIILQNRDFFLAKIAERGVILFRGWGHPSDTDFRYLVHECMGMTPWNGFNLRNTPGFIASWLRQYSEGLVGGGDYRRYIDNNTVQLGPAGNSIQGPHTEGAVRPERSRYLTLCCFEPAPVRGETGMVDFNTVYKALPEEMRQKYDRAWNHFSYRTARKPTLFDRIVVRFSPMASKRREDGHLDMVVEPSPLVVRVPENDLPCLQPWAFARNTNGPAFEAAKAVFSHRCELRPDHTAQNMDLTWTLTDETGAPMEWTEEEQKQLFETTYRKAQLMNWQKGDIAFVDNVRVGHWRMDGEQGNRKIVQIQTTSFDASGFAQTPAAGAQNV